MVYYGSMEVWEIFGFNGIHYGLRWFNLFLYGFTMVLIWFPMVYYGLPWFLVPIWFFYCLFVYYGFIVMIMGEYWDIDGYTLWLCQQFASEQGH